MPAAFCSLPSRLLKMGALWRTSSLSSVQHPLDIFLRPRNKPGVAIHLDIKKQISAFGFWKRFRVQTQLHKDAKGKRGKESTIWLSSPIIFGCSHGSAFPSVIDVNSVGKIAEVHALEQTNNISQKLLKTFWYRFRHGPSSLRCPHKYLNISAEAWLVSYDAVGSTVIQRMIVSKKGLIWGSQKI